MKHLACLWLCTATLLTLTGTALASSETKLADTSTGFNNFVGTWTLKDDKFEQVWDGQTVERITIPNHITVCTSVTTASSVSCSVDANGLTGQIFWVADESRKTLHHLSHFGDRRLGVGTGTISPEGNLTNRITFTDEPDGTYRLYEYKWITPDEYWMMSRQYNADQELTGNYYAGTFVRVKD